MSGNFENVYITERDGTKVTLGSYDEKEDPKKQLEKKTDIGQTFF